jgi:hypothetical protein
MIFRYYSNGGHANVIVDEEHIFEHDWNKGFYRVFEKLNSCIPLKEFLTYDDYLSWRTAQERVTAWKPTLLEEYPSLLTVPVKDHINPSHYQAYIKTLQEELQWLEAMQYLPRFRNPEVFIGAVELQGRKYWDRNGGKDEEAQELQKGIWYFKFLLAYILNDRKPIRVCDINNLIGDMGQGLPTPTLVHAVPDLQQYGVLLVNPSATYENPTLVGILGKFWYDTREEAQKVLNRMTIDYKKDYIIISKVKN